jgi:hypothetical protein
MWYIIGNCHRQLFLIYGLDFPEMGIVELQSVRLSRVVMLVFMHYILIRKNFIPILKILV